MINGEAAEASLYGDCKRLAAIPTIFSIYMSESSHEMVVLQQKIFTVRKHWKITFPSRAVDQVDQGRQSSSGSREVFVERRVHVSFRVKAEVTEHEGLNK